MLRFGWHKTSAVEFESLENVYPASCFDRLATRPFGMGRLFAAMLVVVAASAGCHAQNNCPWLNVATASGALGAPSTLTLNKISDGSTTCIFRSQSGSSVEDLTVSVTVVADPQNVEQDLKTSESRCASTASPLKAIGNDAVLCANNVAQSHGQQVIGRVRDQIFVISITAGAMPSSGTSNDAMAEKVKLIAEQVAGNLF